MKTDKLTVPDLLAKKQRGERIVALTAYDYVMAQLLDRAGVDFLLVGDSVGDNVLGFDNTLSVTLDMVVHHTAAVARGTHRALVVTDMPFLSAQVGVDAAVANAGRLIQQGGAQAVKLEGAGPRTLQAVRALVEAGLPVMGHVGYTPQSTHSFGRQVVRGRRAEGARLVLEAAERLEAAGCFAVVLECTPAPLSKLITETLSIPTIGIGAGAQCDGQVLIVNDLLNLGGPDAFRPRFARQYADLQSIVGEAVSAYAADVRTGRFPAEEHGFDMPAEEMARVLLDREPREATAADADEPESWE